MKKKRKTLKLIPASNQLENINQCRIKLINRFCEHLERGFSEKSFRECDYLIIENYANEIDRKNNNCNLSNKIQNAVRSSLYYWESKLVDLMNNKSSRINIQLCMFVLKCRFGWENYTEKMNNNSQKVVEVQLKLNDEWI
jgi:hypothetical protein